MAQLSNLIVTGASRFLNNIYGNLVGTVNGFSIAKSVPADAEFTDTKYTVKQAVSGGTADSLVTTGQKYIWNNKSDLELGTTATTAAKGNHTHTISIATDSGTNKITLAFGTKYKLTAGGSSYVFTMPSSPTSIAGNAASATKLETARQIKADLSSVYDASTNHPTFDGSGALTAPITGTLGVAHGGTGKDTLTTNGILYGNGTSAIGATSAGSAGQVLTSNGSSAPGWTSQSSITAGKATTLATGREIKVDLESIYHSTNNHPTFNGSGNFTAPITGTLGVGHGGTGTTTFTANGILYGNSTNAVGVTGAGTSGYLLKANGANSAPSWLKPDDLTAGAAKKLSTSRTITLAVASGANGGVTGSASTTFDGNVTIKTTLASHTHAASDITSGILDVARGGTGYGVIDDTPTSGSNYVIRSSGVHKRIAYKKILLDKTAWTLAYDQFNTQNEVVYRQAIGTGNDITANTEIVSVQLVGSSVDTNTTENYSETFTGDGSTKKFTLARTPTNVVSVTRGGIGTDAYTVSGKEVTLTEAPNTGISVVISYNIVYRNDREFAKIRTAETYASVIDFVAKSAPSVDLTIVVGYVSETLDTLSTQATLPTNNRYTSEEYNVSV